MTRVRHVGIDLLTWRPPFFLSFFRRDRWPPNLLPAKSGAPSDDVTLAATELNAAETNEFHAKLFCVLSRYKAICGGGFQCALPPRVWQTLRAELGLELEGFASPLNCTLDRCEAHIPTVIPRLPPSFSRFLPSLPFARSLALSSLCRPFSQYLSDSSPHHRHIGTSLSRPCKHALAHGMWALPRLAVHVPSSLKAIPCMSISRLLVPSPVSFSSLSVPQIVLRLSTLTQRLGARVRSSSCCPR